jgi:hypothetical protein
MTPDEIRRSWDDDDTPRSVFPEPLAERLTRENKELRAEVERLTGEVAALNYRSRMLDARWKGFRDSKRSALKQSAATSARLDALVADLRGLADDMGMGYTNPAFRLRAVLGKHTGEQP